MSTAPRNAPSSRGFTLIEVMVALTIMSLVMVALYTTLNTTLRTRDQLETEARTARLGPQILDLIENDLRRSWLLDIDGDKVFKGEPHTINGEPADSLSFLTTVDSTVSRRVDDREVSSDICETGYRLRINPAVNDVLELWRRQSFHIDEEPLDDGVYELIHDRVVSLQIRYYGTLETEAEERQEWDVSEAHRLPALVDIVLELETAPRSADDLGRSGSAARALRYHRVIPLAADSDLILRVHPLPPTFTGGTGADGAGGADANYDTDGDGIPDAKDPDIDGDEIPNESDDDIDGDGFLNADDQSPNGGGPPGAGPPPGSGGQGSGEGSDDPNGNGNPGGDNGNSGAGDDFSDALEDLLNGLNDG